MSSPYSNLPPTAFWRSAVSDRPRGNFSGIYAPKWPISKDTRIFTAGSCFAQHIGRTLRAQGFTIIDREVAPMGMTAATAARFGYGLYSARYGNIYTARHLRQLCQEAWGEIVPADPVWTSGDRYFDSQRPSVEPDGHDRVEFVHKHRQAHLAAIRSGLKQAEIVVFTFGLTEAWLDRKTGTVFPTAPGTIAGHYDPERFVFHNFTYEEILKDFEIVRKRLRKRKPDTRFLVTVSPVPLTATASGDHVEVATAHSKAIMRAVCGHLSRNYYDVDYFPSYEIITSQSAGGAYYADNLRTVTDEGVATAMGTFLTAHGFEAGTPVGKLRSSGRTGSRTSSVSEVQCEDELLEAFSR